MSPGLALAAPDIERTELSDDARALRAVAAVQAGDESAFRTIFMLYYGRVLALAGTILRDPHEAEDAAQECFMKVLHGLPRYRPRDGVPFRAWLLRIARNTALTRLSRTGRRAAPMEPDAILEWLPEHRDGEADWLQDERFAAELEPLPLRQRQVLVLRFGLDLSPAEAGAVMDLSADAVRQLQARALRSLRRRLSPAPPERIDLASRRPARAGLPKR